MAKTLLKICYDYITRPSNDEGKSKWINCSLFCLPFKIYKRILLNTYFYCTCKPFIYKRKCYNLDHEKLPILDWRSEHCILYSFDACAFRENLEEIFDKLKSKPEGIDDIFYTSNKFFMLLHCYWGFGQPDKEKHEPLYNHLNFSLPGVAICRCAWSIN